MVAARDVSFMICCGGGGEGGGTIGLAVLADALTLR